MHDAITIGVPVLAILFGILVNQQGICDVKAEIASLRAEMNNRFAHTDSRVDRVQADLQQFFRTLGEHDKAIDILERREK